MTSLALPVPALTVGHILGVPESGHPRFEKLAVEAMTQRGPDAFQALFDAVRTVADGKRQRPGDDMISRVLREHVDPGRSATGRCWPRCSSS